MYGTVAWDSAVFIDGDNITRFTDLSTYLSLACDISDGQSPEVQGTDTGLFIGTVKEEGMEVVVANNKESRLVPVPVKGMYITFGRYTYDHIISYDGKLYIQGNNSI